MKKLLLLCSLFLAPCAFAYQNYPDYDYYAQEEYGLKSNTTRVEFYGGVAEPQDNWTYKEGEIELGKTGFSAGLAFVRNISPVFSLGLDANYTGFASGEYTSKKDQITAALPGGGIISPIQPAPFSKLSYSSKFSTGIATGMVTGRINFFPSHATRLYIPVGAGVGHMFVKEKFTSGKHTTTNSTSWAAMIGVGLEFDIDESIIFGIEGRYNLINLEDELSDAIGKDRYHWMSAMLKIGCRF